MSANIKVSIFGHKKHFDCSSFTIIHARLFGESKKKEYFTIRGPLGLGMGKGVNRVTIVKDLSAFFYAAARTMRSARTKHFINVYEQHLRCR